MYQRGKSLSRKQILDIGKVLETLLIKNEDGTLNYKEGDSDTTVAKLFDVKPQQVAYLRQEAFGDLKKATKTTAAEAIELFDKKLQDLTSKVESIRSHVNDDEAKLHHLKSQIQDVSDRLLALEAALGVVTIKKTVTDASSSILKKVAK